MENKKVVTACGYIKVGQIGKLDSLIKLKVKDTSSPIVAGEYIRVREDSSDAIFNSIYEQEQRLEQYCKENNIINRIQYIDIGKSANDNERHSFNAMIKDLKEGKINKIIVTDVSKLYRNPIKLMNFLISDYIEEIEIISLDESIDEVKLEILQFIDEVEGEI